LSSTWVECFCSWHSSHHVMNLTSVFPFAGLDLDNGVDAYWGRCMGIQYMALLVHVESLSCKCLIVLPDPWGRPFIYSTWQRWSAWKITFVWSMISESLSISTLFQPSFLLNFESSGTMYHVRYSSRRMSTELWFIQSWLLGQETDGQQPSRLFDL